MAITLEYDTIKIDVGQVKELYTAMSELVYADMDRQYKEKKINGSTYASTWAELMKAVVAGSMSTVGQLQMKETDADRCVKLAQCDLYNNQADEVLVESIRKDCLSTADCKLKDKQTEKVSFEIDTVLPAQVEFTERQTKGFDDNKMQKMLEIQMNAWAMMFSSGLMSSVPAIVSGDSASSLYCVMSSELDIPDSGNVCDPCSSSYDPAACAAVQKSMVKKK